MAATASRFARAFQSLLNANDRACGTPQFVLVNGKKKRAIISDVSSEIIEAFGGKADAGGFSSQCAVSEFSEDPERGDTVQKLGEGPVFEILGAVRKTNDTTYEFVAGDPAAEER